MYFNLLSDLDGNQLKSCICFQSIHVFLLSNTNKWPHIGLFNQKIYSSLVHKLLCFNSWEMYQRHVFESRADEVQQSDAVTGLHTPSCSLVLSTAQSLSLQWSIIHFFFIIFMLSFCLLVCLHWSKEPSLPAPYFSPTLCFNPLPPSIHLPYPTLSGEILTDSSTMSLDYYPPTPHPPSFIIHPSKPPSLSQPAWTLIQPGFKRQRAGF